MPAIPHGRVQGGTPAEQGRFNFQVALPDDGCGGTLIAPNVVLTAGHCGDIDGHNVVLGCVDVNDLSKCEVIPVLSTHRFPGYTKNMTTNGDAELLVLERDSIYEPITLAAPGFDVHVGQDLAIIGWGISDFYNLEDPGSDGILMEGNVQATDTQACDDVYRKLYEHLDNNTFDEPRKFITDYLMCAVGQRQNSCYGDSGGPIFLRCDATGEDVQVGVVAFSYLCSGVAPAAYTKIFNPTIFGFIEDFVESQGHTLKTIGSTSEFCLAPSEANLNDSIKSNLNEVLVTGILMAMIIAAIAFVSILKKRKNTLQPEGTMADVHQL